MMAGSGTVRDIRESVHIHPALSEVVQRAFSGQFTRGGGHDHGHDHGQITDAVRQDETTRRVPSPISHASSRLTVAAVDGSSTVHTTAVPFCSPPASLHP